MSTRSASVRRLSCLGMALVVVSLATVQAAPWQQDLVATVSYDSSEGSNSMKFYVGASAVRMDMSSDRGDTSMVWADGGMLMIMHSQRMYMEFTREMMQRMQQMMGSMGQMGGAAAGADESPEIDPSDFSFQVTGSTDEINGMSVFEVAMTGPEGQSGQLWMSASAEIGLFEVFTRMLEPLSSMTMPGMQRNNPAMSMQQYMVYARAQGLPDGKVIRLVDGERGTTITLGEFATGPLAATTWQAPEGYEKTQMPTMRQ